MHELYKDLMSQLLTHSVSFEYKIYKQLKKIKWLTFSIIDKDTGEFLEFVGYDTNYFYFKYSDLSICKVYKYNVSRCFFLKVDYLDV